MTSAKLLGDYQTPFELCRDVCKLILSQGIKPLSVIDPTCGVGNFLFSAMDTFDSIKVVVGNDINKEYIKFVRHKADTFHKNNEIKIELYSSDFFDVNWKEIIDSLPMPILIIGNPPWIRQATSRKLGGASYNYQDKGDHHRVSREAIGDKNYDISELLCQHMLNFLRYKDGVLAMLCKATVAREVLKYAWDQKMNILPKIYKINAKKYFGVNVDAVLLWVERSQDERREKTCCVYSGIHHDVVETVWGYDDDLWVSNLRLYEQWKVLRGRSKRWRSGIKHDSIKTFVMTLRDNVLFNGWNEVVDVEDESVYPFLRSHDLLQKKLPSHWILVPQEKPGDIRDILIQSRPKTWAYLSAHMESLSKRKSKIYHNYIPHTYVFGVGDYSFSPWKIAISTFDKNLNFNLVHTYRNKVIMLDDTCYFLPFLLEEEAQKTMTLLMEPAAQEYLRSLIFDDVFRPVTARILNSLAINALIRYYKI